MMCWIKAGALVSVGFVAFVGYVWLCVMWGDWARDSIGSGFVGFLVGGFPFMLPGMILITVCIAQSCAKAAK